MRYVFIVNPTAGKRNPYQTVFPLIANYFRQHGLTYVCHVTALPKQATELTRRQGSAGDAVRIYAVGGDGTFSEVAAGAIGMPNVEIGVIPCGSGNDYVKTFGNIDNFLSPEKQMNASSRWVDMIESDGQSSINVGSVGLDAKIGMEMKCLKKLPFFKTIVDGPAIYNLAAAKILFSQRLGDHLRVTIDGENYYEDTYLFALAASGRYYGGGYCCAPLSIPDDGLLDFILIKKPPFVQIPALTGIFKAGKHLISPAFRSLVTFHRGRRMDVEALKPVAANFDGEYCLIQKETFQARPKAVRFLVPD